MLEGTALNARLKKFMLYPESNSKQNECDDIEKLTWQETGKRLKRGKISSRESSQEIIHNLALKLQGSKLSKNENEGMMPETGQKKDLVTGGGGERYQRWWWGLKEFENWENCSIVQHMEPVLGGGGEMILLNKKILENTVKISNQHL